MGVTSATLYLVRVWDNQRTLLGSAAHRPGDDVLAIARKLLREKKHSSGFYAPLKYHSLAFARAAALRLSALADPEGPYGLHA